MKILDLSAGKRAMWFDKERKDTFYIDIRSSMKPDMVCDSRDLNGKVGDGYNLIVFDPPHANTGANSALSKQYGHFTHEEIRDLISKTGREAYKVSAKEALMIFKWNNRGMKLEVVLNLLDPWWEPLFGQVTSNNTKYRSTTTWVVLKRRLVII